MEIKKSNTASLDGKRLQGFLLGLIVVLSAIITALEYTSVPGTNSGAASSIDEWAQDLEMFPAQDTRDMIVAAPTAPAPVVTEKIKAVDQQALTPDKVAQPTVPNATGEGLGTLGEALAGQEAETLALSPVPLSGDEAQKQLTIAEQLPEFPGGMVEFMKWLTRNLRYPFQAQEQKIEGQVVVSFIVNKDGTVADVKLEKSAHPLLDREALRVVRMMPPWKPGISNQKPCRSMVAIPVVFKR